MLGQRRRRWPSIKTALDHCLVQVVSCNQFSGYINAVNLYSIGNCWPTLDRPRHAHFAVESFFNADKPGPLFPWWSWFRYSYMWLIVLRQDTGKCVFTVDTDVVILVIAHYNNIRPNELWIVLAHDHISAICPCPWTETASLDSRMCLTLYVFHTFRGCDIVSSFGGGGGGNKTDWVTWQSYPEPTDAFEDLLLLQEGISDQTMSTFIGLWCLSMI